MNYSSGDMMLNRVEIGSVFTGDKGFQYRDGANSSNVWPS